MAKSMITPPNEAARSMRDRRENDNGMNTGHAGSVRPANESTFMGDKRNGSYPQGGQASSCNPPNERLRFDAGTSKMEQTPAVTRPAPGAIPVFPGDKAGSMSPAYRRDAVKR